MGVGHRSNGGVVYTRIEIRTCRERTYVCSMMDVVMGYLLYCIFSLTHLLSMVLVCWCSYGEGCACSFCRFETFLEDSIRYYYFKILSICPSASGLALEIKITTNSAYSTPHTPPPHPLDLTSCLEYNREATMVCAIIIKKSLH